MIEIAITCQKQPYRHSWYEAIEKRLCRVDKNGDGKLTWTEALNHPQFVVERTDNLKKEKIKRIVLAFDSNRNGLVDAHELRDHMGLAPLRFSASVQQHTDVIRLLDVNRDGQLSTAEFDGARLRLNRYDENGDTLLDHMELAGDSRYRTVARLLPPAYSNWEVSAVFNQLRNHYRTAAGRLVAGAFPALPKLFDNLDENRNGRIDRTESQRFATIEPHFRIEAAFRQIGQHESTIELSGVAEVFRDSVTKPPGKIVAKIPGAIVYFVAKDQARNDHYANSAHNTIKRLDTDNNGILERQEVQQNRNRDSLRQFDLWDLDTDRMVTHSELVEFLQLHDAPSQRQVGVCCSYIGSPLFSELDDTGDKRLSLRENHRVAERIKKHDQNGDGMISFDEAPVILTVAITRGADSYSYQPEIPIAGQRVKLPVWFNRMDRNGDGDLTLREWLGRKEQFDTFDLNGDGVIEPSEAAAADKEFRRK